jgi:hypothetical protein
MVRMKRVVVSIVVLLLSVLASVMPTAVAAQQSVIVGSTAFDWTGAWQYDAASSMDQQATLTQVDPATGSIKLATYGEFFDATVAGPSQALDTFATAFFEGAGASTVVEHGAGHLDDGAAWKSYTFDLQGLDLSFLVTVIHRSDGAYVVSTLTGNTDQFSATIEQAQREITLNGQPIYLDGVDAAVVTPSTAAGEDSHTQSGSLGKGAAGSASLPDQTNRAPSSSGNLEILSVTMKDAGIGDGSIYVYVEVTNASGKLYSYVGVEGTCRDASGGILGTGIGNTMNVAAGETVVITMIIMGVPGCTDVDVRFDGLTGMV